MNRYDVALSLLIGAVVLGAAAVFIAAVSVGAEASVFSVTDEDRGLIRMHHELVQP